MCVRVFACTRTCRMRVCMPRVAQCGPQTWAQCLTVCLGWSWDNCWLSGVFSLLLPFPLFSCPRFDYNQVFFLILQWAKEQHTVQRASQWAASCWMVSNTWGSDQLVSLSAAFLAVMPSLLDTSVVLRFSRDDQNWSLCVHAIQSPEHGAGPQVKHINLILTNAKQPQNHLFRDPLTIPRQSAACLACSFSNLMHMGDPSQYVECNVE